jgi:DNA invertase Pin-like site-specific DNA recombinase
LQEKHTAGRTGGGKGGEITSADGRRLTPEEVEEYKRLKAEGMSPELARAAVLREDVEW